MQFYLVLAVTFTVAQTLVQALSNTPLSNIRSYNSPLSYQGQLGYPQRLALGGRREFQETLQQESGNMYDGQRRGQFLTRDNRDNLRGFQYSSSGNRDYDSYQQQRFRPASEYGQGLGYSGRNPQISYSSPLANTRSFNPRFEGAGNRQNDYGYY